jgi:uroporphyrinogen-III decarboxylase
MLTIRQNLLETIHGGNPDRFVDQYEFLDMVFASPSFNPKYADPNVGFPSPGGPPARNAWGVWISWPAGLPGPFPLHDSEHKLLKDITKWRDIVKMPRTDYPEDAWGPSVEQISKVDRKEKFATIMMAPGVFEQLHYLMGMDDCLANFYEEPEYMKELIDFITEYELKSAEPMLKYLKPDALFHHDDWGSQRSSFLSPGMFEEFIEPAYKRIYKFHKDHGVQIIVHHSDSYAANLVPSMIRVGIDVFQGCVSTNNVPDLIKKYGGKISFMGDLDNGKLDRADWTPEEVIAEVERVCRQNGTKYYIPCLTMGGPGSTFPGVYEKVSEEIHRMSKELYK